MKKHLFNATVRPLVLYFLQNQWEGELKNALFSISFIFVFFFLGCQSKEETSGDAGSDTEKDSEEDTVNDSETESNTEYETETGNDTGTDSSKECKTEVVSYTCTDSESDNCITEICGGGSPPSLAIGPDGYGMIAFSDSETWLLKCKDMSCSDADKYSVERGDTDYGGGSWMGDPALKIGSDNLPIIAFTYIDSNGRMIAHCQDTSCKNITKKIWWVSDVESHYLTINIGSDGLPIYVESMTYLGDQGYWGIDDLDLHHCADISCNYFDGGSQIDFHDQNDQGVQVIEKYDPSITIGSDGYGLISYSVQVGDILRIAHCSDMKCNTIEKYEIDKSGSIGISSIATGSDGLGIISYSRTGKLMVAHCDNVECSSAQIKEIDTERTGGSAIAIGEDGLPIIGYFGESSGVRSLKIAHCKDIICTSAEVYAVDDDMSTADETEIEYYSTRPSIAIGSDGLPLIAYSDNGKMWGSIRIFHCSNVKCGP